MDDLIYRAALLADIAASVVFSGRTARNAEISGANKIIDRIKAAPKVEAEPVKHARWKQATEPLGWDEVDCIECSECQESWIIDEDFEIDEASEYWHYCPNCGTKMDGERKEND